ncbi:transglycosylase SLT domain-containing protein [Leptospira idonii]|uniref:Lytic transglycosylase domain-containing protein n=1 Tax=Leptospira idonii TaxID=1193500 RepID=A0A4R9M438_9LEPT|nr:transglycosylase SLT domain-containing protein [Leptospira idonii]TGN20741.1 lytic transglycosylase domain-containing protein [Leptospira idonii]
MKFEKIKKTVKIFSYGLILCLFLFESYGKTSSESDFRTQEREIARIGEYIGKVRPSLSRSERKNLAQSLFTTSHLLVFPKNSRFAGEKKIDKVAFLIGVVQTESQFKRTAKSHKGALGYMQIMPATAKWLSKTKRIPYSQKKDLFDTHTNLQMGVLYLNDLMKETGSPTDALLAYNAGLGGWKRWGGLSSYPKSIGDHYHSWKEFETAETLSSSIALLEEE